MQVEWYGQSSFRLSDGQTTVFIAPVFETSELPQDGRQLAVVPAVP